MQYESVRRDEVVGVLLALFLGCFGIHHFYLGRVGLGIVYCCFSWTGIPAFLGLIECFFMPGRVRAYNAVQAAGLAAALGLTIPMWANYPGWVAPAAPAQNYAGYPPAQSTGLVPATSGLQSSLLACGNCGHANAAAARFCANCGSNLLWKPA
jgi:TM2 domain-containing membrane protein YozV